MKIITYYENKNNKTKTTTKMQQQKHREKGDSMNLYEFWHYMLVTCLYKFLVCDMLQPQFPKSLKSQNL